MDSLAVVSPSCSVVSPSCSCASATVADLLKEVAAEHDREVLALQKENLSLRRQIQELKAPELKSPDDEVPLERNPTDIAVIDQPLQFLGSDAKSKIQSWDRKPADLGISLDVPAGFQCQADTMQSSGNDSNVAISSASISPLSSQLTAPSISAVQKPIKSVYVSNFDEKTASGAVQEVDSSKAHLRAEKEHKRKQMQEPNIIDLDGNCISDCSGKEGPKKMHVKPKTQFDPAAPKLKGSSYIFIEEGNTDKVEDADDSSFRVLDRGNSRYTIGSTATSGFSSYDLMESDANGYKHANELRKWFAFLDPSRKRFLTPKDIHGLIVKIEGYSRKSVDWVERTLESLNVTLTVMPDHCLKSVAGPFYAAADRSSSHSNSSSVDCPTDSDLQFPGFVELILWDNFSLFAKDVSAVLYIRDVLIKASVEELVVKASHLEIPREIPKHPYSLTVLEPIVAFVIFSNALTIGLQSEVDWNGWYGTEIGFTSFFIGEVIFKVCICGFCEHFWRGDDAAWNIFDLILVLLATCDLVLTENGRESTIGDAMVIRMVRLARLTRLMRLIRLLRLRFFKELLLMVKGVIAGLRTLFWAFFLLLVTMYVVAVALRQTEMTDDQGVILFKSLGWSMFTVFVCFTGECTLMDGTPLPFLLFRRYDWRFAIPFTIANICIVFGMFNLIMAIFVENVNESSKQKRQLSNEEERAKVCRNLRDLIMKFGGMSSKLEAAARYASINKKKKTNPESKFVKVISEKFSTMTGGAIFRGTVLNRLRATACVKTSLPIVMQPSTSSGASFGTTLSMSPHATDHVDFKFGGQITREVFLERIIDPEVQEMLDDLDIHVQDRTEIFDVVDTEMTGFVEVSDLVAGLLKLRSGGADKSDIVTAILGIRSMRKQMNTFMERVLDNQVQMLTKMDGHAQVLAEVPTDASRGSRLLSAKPKFSLTSSLDPSRCSTFEGARDQLRESWYRPSCISMPTRLSVQPRLQKQPNAMS